MCLEGEVSKSADSELTCLSQVILAGVKIMCVIDNCLHFHWSENCINNGTKHDVNTKSLQDELSHWVTGCLLNGGEKTI